MSDWEERTKEDLERGGSDWIGMRSGEGREKTKEEEEEEEEEGTIGQEVRTLATERKRGRRQEN